MCRIAPPSVLRWWGKVSNRAYPEIGFVKISNRGMTSCHARQENLKAYLDRELPHVRHIAMWWHLLHCANCREALKAMTEIGRRLTVGETDALDPVLRARILSSMTYTDSPREERATGRHRRLWHPLLVGGATA